MNECWRHVRGMPCDDTDTDVRRIAGPRLSRNGDEDCPGMLQASGIAWCQHHAIGEGASVSRVWIGLDSWWL